MKIEYFVFVPVFLMLFYYFGYKRGLRISKNEFVIKPTPGRGKNIDLNHFLLTGKAHDDFWKWYLKTTDNTDVNYIKKQLLFEMREICILALFVDFFDFKGIYIADWGVNAVDGNIGFDSSVSFLNKLHHPSENFSLTRIHSLTLAVKKANELYNNNLASLEETRKLQRADLLDI